MASRITTVLVELLQPVAEGLGYEFVGLEYLPSGKHSVLRIYIDHENGISVDDCERVSHQVSGVLEVEDPIRGQYTLEVSSPGLDRPLFTREHYERFLGQRATVRTDVPLDGRRKFTGVLKTVDDDVLTMDIDGEMVAIGLAQIAKAKLAPLFD